MSILTGQVFLMFFGLMGIASNVLASSDTQPVLLAEGLVVSPPSSPQPPPPPPSLPTPSSVTKPTVVPPAQGKREIPPEPPPVPTPVEPPLPPPPAVTKPTAAPPVKGEREIPYPPPTLIQKPRVTPSVEVEREIPPEPGEPPEEKKPTEFVQQRLADLFIVGIHGSSCLNDQVEADSFYMGTIDVYVGKRDIRATGMHEPGAMVGTLTVKYKDKKSGNSVNQEFVLYNFHFSGGDARVRVSASPVWIVKSTGVFAEIRLKSPDYARADPILGNNSMRIKHCETYPR